MSDSSSELDKIIGNMLRGFTLAQQRPAPKQCDCCGKLVRRLHGVRAYGIETYACDECVDYDAEAYGEEAE